MNKENKTTYKTALTIKEYKISFKGWDIIVPIGSKVSNSTACGNDDEYRFWLDHKEYVEKLTGFKNSLLAHDLKYYGINVPAEYCESYSNERKYF